MKSFNIIYGTQSQKMLYTHEKVTNGSVRIKPTTLILLDSFFLYLIQLT